jgi:dienelactone hydrolase
MIDDVSTTPCPRYDAGGWMHWPDNELYCFQFMKVLGAAQEGGSTISECFLTANRITPGDDESWHKEWKAIADANLERGNVALARGNISTAQSNWLRASNYYRTAELLLRFDDCRRDQVLQLMRICSHRYLKHLVPAGEIIRISCSGGRSLEGYFLRAPGAVCRTPAVICIGGPDHLKDEHLYKMLRHAHARKLSLLLVDLPRQGTPVRQNIAGSQDIEAFISSCVDYLIDRGDVEDRQIAIFGDGLGASFASRAACLDDRFGAAVCDGGILDLHERAFLAQWISGCGGRKSIKEEIYKVRHRIAKRIRCPILVALGEYDLLDAHHAADFCEALKKAGLDISLKVFSATETAASHAQSDNPTIGNEVIFDWIASRLHRQQEHICSVDTMIVR